MTNLYVQVVNGQMAQCIDTPPPVPVGQDGWKNAIEVKPALVPYQQYYEGPFYHCDLDPVEIVWTVHQMTVDERKGGMYSQNTMQFNQTVAYEAKKETDPDETTHYDPAVVEAAQTRYELLRTEIDNATTMDQLDTIQTELNNWTPPGPM